jgi:hypothetical protein
MVEQLLPDVGQLLLAPRRVGQQVKRVKARRSSPGLAD